MKLQAALSEVQTEDRMLIQKSDFFLLCDYLTVCSGKRNDAHRNARVVDCDRQLRQRRQIRRSYQFTLVQAVLIARNTEDEVISFLCIHIDLDDRIFIDVVVHVDLGLDRVV